MKHLGLFEGIGGFSLAARWMGWETLAWCEINPFCQKVLSYHFPHADKLTDIKTTDFKKYANRIDILTGGFPCQPYSTAGKRKGKDDERHLWPEMLRAIREVQPRYVVGENVRGLTNWNGGMVFDEVQADMETQGYEILPFLLPACSKDAPHRRDRIWFIAYSAGNGHGNRLGQGGRPAKTKQESEQWEERHEILGQWNGGNSERIDVKGSITNSNGQGLSERLSEGFSSVHQKTRTQSRGEFTRINSAANWSEFPTQPPVCSGDDGLPAELDGITFSKWRTESIKAYGNAVVPQIPYEIFKAIQAYENTLESQCNPH